MQTYAGVNVVIFSGLIAGVLAMLSSLIATVLLFKTNKKQMRLLESLQKDKHNFDTRMAADRQAFDNKISSDKQAFDTKLAALDQEFTRNLEKYKTELAKSKSEFESELRRNEEFLTQQMKNLFSVVEKSQDCTRRLISSFRGMLTDSRTLDAKKFLAIFNSTIISFNLFSEQISSLEYLVRPKDKKFIRRAKEQLLEMLLGMRFESERRLGQEDFLCRVCLYEQELEKIARIFHAKYRRILQPRSIARLPPP